MNEEVHALRRRLQDLHDGHLTGFVDDAQYAQSRAALERRLIDAVMQQASADAPAAAPAEAEAPALHAEGGSLAPPRGPSRWPLWVAAAAVFHLAAIAVWWAASARPVRPVVAVLPEVSSPALALPVPQAAVTQADAQADSQPATPAPLSSAPRGSGVSGTVALSPALVGRASPSDAVFVYVRAVGGPPFPLAVIRKQVKDLPMAFTLDDSMALWATAKLSGFSQVVVTARVSKSGEGQARNGDLEGQSPPVAVGTNGLALEIGTVVAK